MNQKQSLKKQVSYANRKAAGEEAARWLRSPLDIARAQGSKDCTVSTADLADLLAFVESQTAKDDIAFQGVPLGYARESDIRGLKGGLVRGICVKATRGTQFSIAVFYRDLPEYVKPEKNCLPEDEQ